MRYICAFGDDRPHGYSTCAHHHDHYPHTRFHKCSPYRTLEIWFFVVISQSEQICKWGIKYAHLVATDQTGSTCGHHYPHTKFHKCITHTELWIFVCLVFCLFVCFLLLANQNRYANEVLNMHIWWRQTTRVVLVAITTLIPSFINVAHTELWIFDFFCY